MIFRTTPLDGAYTIELERRQDARGYFARAFCAREFADRGLETEFVQANLSVNAQAGLVRGMHFQAGDDAEVKLVRCVRGAIFDAIVDIRAGSPTHLQWFGAELSEDNGLMMYVPRGFAHGYQSIAEGTMVHYMVSAFYAPDAERGLRHDDPMIGIDWPRPVTDLSEKDRAWPLLERRE
ncbi:MAG: dTDP-4-dehydrorhamnose 3,5-epimerase [Minwuia sp.]|uniref:dTDP-4-dehydrorhamnose 3,5-epimerase n=1 Tax=Minwuia sp. TaxID=2493630 RepID=UPI003A88309D